MGVIGGSYLFGFLFDNEKAKDIATDMAETLLIGGLLFTELSLKRMFQTGKMDNYLSLNAFCRKKGMPLVTTYNPLKLKETGEGIVIEEFVGCKDKGQKSGDFSDHGIQAQNGTFTLYFNNLC